MKQVNFLKSYIRLASFLLVFMFGCNSEKNKQDEILGIWQAHWETKFDDNMPELSSEHLKMNGIINFMSDGKVEISAYGYDGCIFSDDTLNNTLNWKMDDSVLRFIDSGDEHGLPYTINKFSSNELKLTLLEDISLTLTKN